MVKNKRKLRNKGFSLVELVIIIAIEAYVTIDSFLLSIELNPWLLFLVSSLYPIEVTSKKKNNMV